MSFMWNTTLVRVASELVLAQGEGAPPPGGGEGPASTNPFGGSMFMIVAFVAIIYFLMIRPNMKHEKQRREMLAALSKGDEVVTNGGIYGTVIGLTEQTVTLRVNDDPITKIKFTRAAVTRVDPRNEDEQD